MWGAAAGSPGAGVAAAESGTGPPLRIVSSEFSLSPVAQVHADDVGHGSTALGVLGKSYFGQIDVVGDADVVDGLRFAVEGSDDAGDRSWRHCASDPAPVDLYGYFDLDPDDLVDLGDITALTQRRYLTHSIDGEDDPVDWFRFELSQPRRGNIGIRELDAAADMTLFGADGEMLNHKIHTGSEHLMMYPHILEGVYYLKVLATEQAENQYLLAHSTDDPSEDRVTDLRAANRLKKKPCGAVEVGAVPDAGRLFLYRPDAINSFPGFGTGEFGSRRVEVSAHDAETGLKVYREVVIGPAESAGEPSPAPTPVCSDYPAMDADRFACLHKGELRPVSFVPPATTSELRGGLPALIQPASEYSLVFAEEFDGTPAATSCGYDMSSLDSSLWGGFNPDPCLKLDRDGRACQFIADGRYQMAFARDHLTRGKCAAKISTIGKFAYKYGYLEVKYTIKLNQLSAYNILAMVVGSENSTYSNYAVLGEYGIVVDSLEAFGANVAHEIDVFEVYTGNNSTKTNYYFNGHGVNSLVELHRRKAAMRTVFCRSADENLNRVIRAGAICNIPGSLVTITIGMEWTPRGYRWFEKIDGLDDELGVKPVEHIYTEDKYPARTNPDGTGSGVPTKWSPMPASDRERSFEYLTAGDADSYLSQVAVAHVPLPITLVSWGWAPPTTVQGWVDVDYIRVFQPDDRYASMEPVYR